MRVQNNQNDGGRPVVAAGGGSYHGCPNLDSFCTSNNRYKQGEDIVYYRVRNTESHLIWTCPSLRKRRQPPHTSEQPPQSPEKSPQSLEELSSYSVSTRSRLYLDISLRCCFYTTGIVPRVWCRLDRRTVQSRNGLLARKKESISSIASVS